MFLRTGYNHKSLSYRGTIILTRYAHLCKLGFESPTSSLMRTHPPCYIVTYDSVDMIFFYINSEIDL